MFRSIHLGDRSFSCFLVASAGWLRVWVQAACVFDRVQQGYFKFTIADRRY
jgi:hypothetical protein